MANAEATAISTISAALPEGQAAMYLLGIKYLEALPLLTQGKGTTIFLPAEAAGVMGALGGLRELLGATGTSRRESDTAEPRASGVRTAASSGIGAPGVPRIGDGGSGSDDRAQKP